jgi:hypothetical protein
MVRILKDTRRVHAPLFSGLTPTDFDYYAGNYRGSSFTCLRNYSVHIPGDPRVGHLPGVVSRSMAEFAVEVQDTLTEIDRLYRISENVLTKPEKLSDACSFLLRLSFIFSRFTPTLTGMATWGALFSSLDYGDKDFS